MKKYLQINLTNQNMKYFIALIVVSVFLFSLIRKGSDFKIKRIKKENGRFELHYYYKKNSLNKIERFNEHGVKDGISETWVFGENNFHFCDSFSNGQKEKSETYSKDKTLLEKTSYLNGVLDYEMRLIRNSVSPNRYYKKKYENCGWMQYTIMNNEIIDSIFVDTR